MAVARVDALAVSRFVADPAGPVAGELRRRAAIVEAGAKRMVGVQTGRLRNSIHVDMRRGATPEAWIGSNVNYALMHHNGTRRHVITPNMRRTLRFKVGGRVVYATEVMHPGTRPNPYLTVPLQAAGGG